MSKPSSYRLLAGTNEYAEDLTGQRMPLNASQWRSETQVSNSRVNFINILRAHFLYKSLLSSIFLLRVWLWTNIRTKNAPVKCWWNWPLPSETPKWYRVFHGLGQVQFPDGGSVLGSSQFAVLPQLPPKMTLSLKEVKIDSKISNLLS